MVIGLAGLLAVCGIGAYKFRKRGEMSTSVFLMQLRVAAQGTVVGCLSLGLAYTLAQKFLFHSEDQAKILDQPSLTIETKESKK